jgi:hypothetical protein
MVGVRSLLGDSADAISLVAVARKRVVRVSYGLGHDLG